MKTTLVSATLKEIAPTLHFLEREAEKTQAFSYNFKGLQIQVLITGVGLVATTYSLTKYLQHQSPSLMVHLGLAGAFNPELSLKEVVQVDRDRFGDIGIEDSDGKVATLFETGFAPANETPFTRGLLINPQAGNFLRRVEGLTNAKTTGSKYTLDLMKEKYPKAEVETMESAAFFYASLQENVKFLSVRAISNYVEERNKEKWEMAAAIENLNKTSIEMLLTLSV